MNANAPRDDTFMDDKIDTLMRTIDALSVRVDAAAKRLIQKDAASEQREENEEEGSP
jgi:hypothetical protein